MVACIFCGSEDTRPSKSSTLDVPATRIKRALTLRRLYRCRSCDGLFVASSLTVGKPRRRGGKSPKGATLGIFLTERSPGRPEVG